MSETLIVSDTLIGSKVVYNQGNGEIRATIEAVYSHDNSIYFLVSIDTNGCFKCIHSEYCQKVRK